MVFLEHIHVSWLCFYCCDKTPGPKATWEGEGLPQLALLPHSSSLREVRVEPQMGGTPRQKLKQKHGGVLLTALRSLLPSSTLEGVTLPTGMGPSHIPQASLEGGIF